MKSVLFPIALFVSLLSAAGLAHATSHGSSSGSAQTEQTAAALSEGEVRRVDKEAKKLTIRHGPIANLDMPPMTMVFQVQDAAVLDQVKVGDKIRFNAEKVGGSYTVTRVESAK